MDLQNVMKQLKAWEHPKMRAVNAKHGAGENQFRVNLSKLRGLATKIKRDHKLAQEALLESAEVTYAEGRCDHARGQAVGVLDVAEAQDPDLALLVAS